MDEQRLEKLQFGTHLLLFSTAVYAALAVNYLWTGGAEPFGLPGLHRVGVLGAAGAQIVARLLLLSAPGRGWGLAALGSDLVGLFLTPWLHGVAALLSLFQLRLLACALGRGDLSRWVGRLAVLLLAAAVLTPLSHWLAAVALGLGSLRYLRLLYALGTETGRLTGS